MSVKTNNIYGKIVISNNTITKFVSNVAMDCYGIVELYPKKSFSSVFGFLKLRQKDTGVKVRSSGDRIFIDMSIIVKYGISIKAVVEAIKESIKYKVERFTGMLVDTINVEVCGVKE